MTPGSGVLFRFGEQCNNGCPMCPNTGDPALFYHSPEELVRRLDFVRQRGFQRIVATGGEPTIHPGFWTIIERVADYGMTWDINTHGRSFAKPDFAERSIQLGLQLAIVSLHSHDPAVSAVLSGARETAHYETVGGIEHLIDAGAGVMLNCVLTRLNLDHLEEYLQFGIERFGSAVAFKFVFPSTIGKGAHWEGTALRYSEIREPIQRVHRIAKNENLVVCYETIPNCILGDPEPGNYGRSGFGETHYLDDATGTRIYSMEHVEAELSAFSEDCRNCSALKRCSGVTLEYAQRYGLDELSPFKDVPSR